MLVVGLTGGIASGKSTVSRMFEDAGVPVICADELAREAVKPGSAGLREIARVFGSDVIAGDGNLDRVAMARLVFEDPGRRKILEGIIHPRVAEEKIRRLKEYEQQGHKLAIVDVPLLYESGWEDAFDLVVAVYVPEGVQVDRLARRDGLSPEEIRSRIAAQMPVEEKRARAARVVDNSGTEADTYRQVQILLGELRAMAESKAEAACSTSKKVLSDASKRFGGV